MGRPETVEDFLLKSRRFSTHTLLGLPGTSKKDLRGIPPSEVPSLSLSPPLPSSWCPPVRSRRTLRTIGEYRSWFGRPQAIKKGGRECDQQQEDERVENTENHS